MNNSLPTTPTAINLFALYNGIKNDYSIQRYSSNWKIILDKIKTRYQSIPVTNQQFSNRLVLNCLATSNCSLHQDILTFARELEINLTTLRLKEGV